jgi:hypothetical protein
VGPFLLDGRAAPDVHWIYLTIVGGLISGALALVVRRLMRGGAGEGLTGASVSAGV